MIVQLTATTVTVTDADDCTRLHVSTALPAERLDGALRATGSGSLADDGTALLDLDTLRARARAGAVAGDWDDRWQAMVDYAGRKGWLSADGTAVQAHVERATADS